MTDTDRLAALWKQIVAEEEERPVVGLPSLSDRILARLIAAGVTSTPAPMAAALVKHSFVWVTGSPTLLKERDDLLAQLAARPAPDTALDVERLAKVMREMCDCIRSDEDAAAWARDIAREYAALAPADREEEL